MKEAIFWATAGKDIKCNLCPHMCTISQGKTGICKTRKNINGKLWSLVFPHAVSSHPDPIEKKPFYHFLPGELAFSFGTAGCNLCCHWCQNFDISQVSPDKVFSVEISPKKIIEICKQNNYKIIAYTYNEPTVFFEYTLEIAKLAKEAGIKNVIVSNGFINEEPLKELCKFIDAANIDLKSMKNETYQKYCCGKLQPVLNSLKILREKKIHLEITNLKIPGVNDRDEQIMELINWVKDNLGENTPLHFSAFYPCYKMHDKPATLPEAVKNARKKAIEVGMKFVYTGNIHDEEGSSTYCPKCNKVLIRRQGYNLIENHLKDGRCPCGEEVPGVWS